MADSQAPSGPAPLTLAEGHLALVIEDAIVALDPPEESPGPDLRAALLYGWATGATTARELAFRSATDDGLRYLLSGRELSFREVRAYREGHVQELESFYGGVFELLASAGLSRLGRVALPGPAGRGEGAAPYRHLARELLSGAATADLRDDRELGQAARGDELPSKLVSRAGRRKAFQDSLSKTQPAGTSDRAHPRPPRDVDAARRAALDQVVDRASARRRPYAEALGVVVTILVVALGLLLLRWLAAASAPPVEGSRGSVFPLASAPVLVEQEPGTSQLPGGDGSLSEARDEALRLASEALDDDDLPAARDFLFLATQAMADDSEAADRLRQVETALSISTFRGSWDEAVADLGELRSIAPSSRTVLQAYVTSLVGAGRQALAARDLERAAELCGEAVRWFPSRDDARSCLIAASATPTATSQPTAQPTATLQTSTPLPTATIPATATTRAAATAVELVVRPTPVPTEPLSTPLQVGLSGGCEPAAAGSGSTLRISGSVSSSGVPVSSYQVTATAVFPSGAMVPLADTTYLTPVFQIQLPVGAPGAYAIAVTAAKDGYVDGQASIRVSC